MDGLHGLQVIDARADDDLVLNRDAGDGGGAVWALGGRRDAASGDHVCAALDRQLRDE